jgi:AcrR family transcriptional regulator
MLLKAALSCFARNGFEATSLRQLAVMAGVDMALVARLFGSKALLWAAVIEHLSAEQNSHLLRLKTLSDDTTGNPAGAFKQLVEEFAKVGLELPEFPALLMHEGNIQGERLDMLLTKLMKPFRDAARPIISAAMEAGVIHSSDADLCFGLLISAVAIPISSPFLFGQLNREQVSRAIADEAVLLMMRHDGLKE